MRLASGERPTDSGQHGHLRVFLEDETTPESEQLVEHLEEGGIREPAMLLQEASNVIAETR